MSDEIGEEIPATKIPTESEIEALKVAAIEGDVEFLRNAVASNFPDDYFLKIYPLDMYDNSGNIFQLASWCNREEFIREGIEILPSTTIQILLTQQDPSSLMRNLLHYAAHKSQLRIIKLFLQVYISSDPTEKKPWLVQDNRGMTPLHVALRRWNEECAMELLSLNADDLTSLIDEDDRSVLGLAVKNGFNQVALKILFSVPPSCSYSYSGKSNALHYAPKCSEEICRLLLERKPELAKLEDKDGSTAFHYWALDGEVWPFQCLDEVSKNNPELKRDLVSIIATGNDDAGSSLFQWLASSSNQTNSVQIAEMLVTTYTQEIEKTLQASSITTLNQAPWFTKDKQGNTPLSRAIENNNQKLILYLLSLGDTAIIENEYDTLSFALSKGYNEVAVKILEAIERNSWNHLLTLTTGKNVLHEAPRFRDDIIFRRLLDGHSKLLKGIDEDGVTVLHSWVEIGEISPFQYVLQDNKILAEWRRSFLYLMSEPDIKLGNNPLHYAAMSANQGNLQIVELLVQAYKKEFEGWTNRSNENQVPWLLNNRAGDTPLHTAIRSGREDIALFFLEADINTLSMKVQYNPLFLAVECGCRNVAAHILATIKTNNWTHLLNSNRHQNWNVLHLAPDCSEEMGKWLVNELPELITQQPENGNGNTPLDEAAEKGVAWLIKAMLLKEPKALESAPFAWVKACDVGHALAIRAFIEHCPNFRHHCLRQRDTPLHHIRLHTFKEYKVFLRIPDMKDFVNSSNSKGETPLLRAVKMGKQQRELEIQQEKVLEDAQRRERENCSDAQRESELNSEAEQEGEIDLEAQRESELNSEAQQETEMDLEAQRESELNSEVQEKSEMDLDVKRESELNLEAQQESQMDLEAKRESELNNSEAQQDSEMDVEAQRESELNSEAQRESEMDLEIDRFATYNLDWLYLAEALLKLEADDDQNNKKKDDERAMDELDILCKEQRDWADMCIRVGIDPSLKTTYVKRNVNLLDVRNSLSVVAALLATITFTAGLTLPGGFNDDGEAILGKKAAFLVFLISDVLALCCSMLVLVFLIWSMVSDPSKQLFFIDRSLMPLLVALYSTLLSFMTGVFVVLSSKCLWAAILTIIMCCFVGISVSKTLSYNLLAMLIPSANAHNKGTIFKRLKSE